MTYTRLGELGSGEFGTVFLEREDGIGRLCAAKVLSNVSVPKGSRIDEAAIMHASRHAHVAEVYGADVEDGAPVVRMEYFERGSLENIFMGAPVDVVSAIQFGSDAARGLHHLHGLGIAHRDVKSSNLLLSNSNRVKIADFGLAGAFDNSQDTAIAYVPHLAPEEINNGLRGSPAADQFALGMTIYRLLNGDAIFWDSFGRQGGRSPQLQDWLPHVHPQLKRILTKATKAAPQSRYESMAEFRLALEAASPMVSWKVQPIVNGMKWTGAVHSTPSWVLELSKDDQWNVQLTRIAKSGRESKVSGATLETSITQEAYDHTHRLLTRIGLTGRP